MRLPYGYLIVKFKRIVKCYGKHIVIDKLGRMLVSVNIYLTVIGEILTEYKV